MSSLFEQLKKHLGWVIVATGSVITVATVIWWANFYRQVSQSVASLVTSMPWHYKLKLGAYKDPESLGLSSAFSCLWLPFQSCDYGSAIARFMKEFGGMDQSVYSPWFLYVGLITIVAGLVVVFLRQRENSTQEPS